MYKSFEQQAKEFEKCTRIDGFNYRFPLLKGASDKQEFLAFKYRQGYVQNNRERFEYLINNIPSYKEGRFNWELLDSLCVDDAEYVCLFETHADFVISRLLIYFNSQYEYIGTEEEEDE